MHISVIVCTYNPDEKIFPKCLNAIRNLNTTGIEAEITIVDNNSIIPLSSVHYITEFTREVTNSKIIVEKVQGLAYARISGFDHSSGDLIVFFDDDNEPEPDYLINAVKLLAERPFVGVMGPGLINVKYIDNVDPWVAAHLNKYFQEKKAEREEYVLSVMSWFPCYPPGTGQIVRRNVFASYRKMFFEKGITTSDRKGNNLSSAGDSQIIWTSLNMNYAVGHHPEIRINHLIPSRRANLMYIKRLSYYLELSGTIAFAEMYPGNKTSESHYRTSAFLFELLKTYFNAIINKQYKNVGINIGTLVGRNEAYVKINKTKVPFLLRKAKTFYKLT